MKEYRKEKSARGGAPKRTRTRAFLITDRRRQATQLYLTGAVTQRAIAATLGVSHVTISRDLAAVMAEWRTEYLKNIDERVRLEEKKLDLAEITILEGLYQETFDGRGVALKPLPLDYFRWARIAVGVIAARRARLLGLDAPTRVEVYGRIDVPITVESVRELPTEKLDALLVEAQKQLRANNGHREKTNGSKRRPR